MKEKQSASLKPEKVPLVSKETAQKKKKEDEEKKEKAKETKHEEQKSVGVCGLCDFWLKQVFVGYEYM